MFRNANFGFVYAVYICAWTSLAVSLTKRYTLYQWQEMHQHFFISFMVVTIKFNSEAMCGVSQGCVSSTAAVLDGASGAMHSTFFVSGMSPLTSGKLI